MRGVSPPSLPQGREVLTGLESFASEVDLQRRPRCQVHERGEDLSPPRLSMDGRYAVPWLSPDTHVYGRYR
jgi:hypothetical protein